jgi:hypothetical protein
MDKTIAESPGREQTDFRHVERTLLSAALDVDVGVLKPGGIRNNQKNKNKSSGQECPLHICGFG